MNDRSSEETKLNVSFKNTKQIWLETFGVPYAVPGGMYRGEPPPSYFLPQWVSGDESAHETSALQVELHVTCRCNKSACC